MKFEKILVSETQSAHLFARTKTRVAAYCRVSTDSKDQLLSYETQLKTYREKINAAPEWEFAGIYADEGVTGTRVELREGFKQMVADCEAGKIDYIITKSISRFARNTLQCLTYIRHLQALGVQLIFEKEGIDTGAAYSEMLLTILAAFAQEESRSISENIKWGIRKRFEEGKDRWTRVYGYTADENGTYRIVPNEAEVIGMIFSLYEQGRSMAQISDSLLERGIPSPAGKPKWEPSSIMTILRNEKYVGDILLQKVYNEDHLSHRKVRNDMTQIPGYYIKTHHAAIIDRKTFDRVQKIRTLTCQGGRCGKGQSIQYPFDRLLVCPHCKGRLKQKKLLIQDNSRAWLCAGCGGFILKNKLIGDAVIRAYRAADRSEADRQLDGTYSAEAEAFLDFKNTHETLEKVEFFWLDELVERIEFGAHATLPSADPQAGDRTITVYWKCGFATTVPSGVKFDKDSPIRLVELYNAYLARQSRKMQEEGGEQV